VVGRLRGAGGGPTIAEPPQRGDRRSAGGFRPEHPAFWLFATRLHERQQGLRIEPPEPPEGPGLAIDTLATVDRIFWVEDPARLATIEAWHVWTPETVLQRFHYRRPGLWVLGVRVFRRGEPWRVEHDPGFDGCKSWVPLGRELSTDGLRSVIDEDEHARRMAALGEALGDPVGRLSGGVVASHD
jgi:hypothetical protein